MPQRALAEFDLLCFSHLGWDFVLQRPQHLLTRRARERRVFYIEEPIFEDGITPRLERHLRGSVTVVVPHLPVGQVDPDEMQRALVDDLIAREDIADYVTWYHTPILTSEALAPCSTT